MSLLLGLDTATDRATVAVGTATGSRREVALPARRELSRDIERVTAELLAGGGATVRDLTGVIVADGPGSFTGLRIGIAFAKGVCRAAGLPLWAAPSMLGAAVTASRSAGATVGRLTVVVEYDALRGEVYRAVYGFESGAVTALAPPQLEPAGSRVDSYAACAMAGEPQASAASLILLTAVREGAVRVPDPASWEPAYGRRAEAEARRLRRGGGNER